MARLVRDNDWVEETELHFAGIKSAFAGTVRFREPGEYTLQILAADPSNANFGRSNSRRYVVR